MSGGIVASLGGVKFTVSSAASTGLDGTYYYHDGPTITSREASVEIGGNICHLCGAEKDYESNYSHKTKHGKWKRESLYGYKCGTKVSVSPKGQRKVNVGDKCIKVAGS